MELLLIRDAEKQCYVYIKDFNRLTFSFSRHMHCLQCFYSEIDLEKHLKDCIVINGV